MLVQLVKTSYKFTGSVFDEVIGVFHWLSPSSHSVALGSTRPLKEMSTRSISWVVKAASAWGWQPWCANCPEILGASTSWSL